MCSARSDIRLLLSFAIHIVFLIPLRGVQVDVGNRMLAAGSRCLQRQAAIHVPALQVLSCRNLMTLAIETSW